MDYTGKRLNDLESETHGDGSRVQTIVEGWNVITYPNGEKSASLEADYNKDTDFTFDIEGLAYISENIPNSIFTEVTDCSVNAIDISPSSTNKNSIVIATNGLYGVETTGIKCFMPLEFHIGLNDYNLPTKLHIVWSIRGI